MRRMVPYRAPPDSRALRGRTAIPEASPLMPASLLSRLITFLMTLVAIAVLTRVVWELLAPLLPVIGGVLVITIVAAGFVQRNRRW